MENFNLTEHFTFFELFYAQMPKMGKDLNDEFIKNEENKQFVIDNLKKLAIELEKVRAYLNTPLIITSGFRAPKWEEYKKRTGKSQHAQALAVDIHCSKMNDLYNYYKNINWLGGLGDGRKQGFIHLDLRTPTAYQIQKKCGARWGY